MKEELSGNFKDKVRVELRKHRFYQLLVAAARLDEDAEDMVLFTLVANLPAEIKGESQKTNEGVKELEQLIKADSRIVAAGRELIKVVKNKKSSEDEITDTCAELLREFGRYSDEARILLHLPTPEKN